MTGSPPGKWGEGWLQCGGGLGMRDARKDPLGTTSENHPLALLSPEVFVRRGPGTTAD